MLGVLGRGNGALFGRPDTGRKSHWVASRSTGPGRLFFYESSTFRDALPGKARAFRGRENARRREPGNLPANEGILPDLGRGFPDACTEVVMAVSNTSSITLSASDRLIAGVLALLLGGFLVFGAGLANSAVLHDTAHDTRHSYGFPCH
jgi:cobalt transporter subunit CbtB